MSRDERYTREYPKNLPNICKDYITDLIEEGQIIGDEHEMIGIKKALGKKVFGFIKDQINNN